MQHTNTLEALIVGGDGLIGGNLVSRLAMNGISVIATSRRPTSRSKCVSFDLVSGDTHWLQTFRPDFVIICAAMTDMRACELDPATSGRINIAGTVKLIGEMLARGIFVVFLSSNTVFDGTIPDVSEEHPCCPSTEYGRQKATAEQQLFALPGADSRMTIVRLSKVLSPQAGIAADFLHRLRSGQSCDAFDDLLLCPASIDYVVDGLIRIATARIPGVFHLSGEEEMSYAQLARLLASCIGADVSLVRPTTSEAKGVEVLFRPRHPALGMVTTRHVLGLRPEPTSHLLDELVAGYGTT